MTAQQAFRWVGCILGVVGLTGCNVPSWDDLTSRELGVKALWTTPPPPMTVIEKSTDGYARAKALNMLDESSNRAESDKNLQVLQAAATTDRDPLCRIAALRTLGRYKDPRASKVLMDVLLGNPGLSAENNALIRQQALTSLRTQSPTEAKQFFITAAKQPKGSLTDASQRDRMEILDERLTAIRALGKYPEPDAVETLVKLLETEKDTAIRRCAHESLKESQKKDIPEDGKAWREYVATGRTPPPQNTGTLASFLKSDPSSSGTGVLDSITNFMRPEKAPEPIPAATKSATPISTSPPASLPTSLPTAPLAPTTTPGTLPNPNQVRRTPAPPPLAPPTPNPVVPAGASRNAQGELIVPVSP